MGLLALAAARAAAAAAAAAAACFLETTEGGFRAGLRVGCCWGGCGMDGTLWLPPKPNCERFKVASSTDGVSRLDGTVFREIVFMGWS